MKETTGTTADAGGRARRDRDEASREPATLPQWAIELFVRPVLHTAFKLTWGLSLTGVENIPCHTKGGLIVAANHQTYIDPFWISAPLRRPIRYLAWDEALEWPVVGKVMKLLGAWPLQIEGRDPAAVRRSLQWLREGGAIVIFPEGGRAKEDGRVAKFKPGAARIALEANVPVLPVTIRGGNDIWPRGRRLPGPGKVEIVYHPPRYLAPLAGEDVRHCARRETELLAKVIGSAL
ncbi:MAG: lysophospholipid acyltransferase family protein [Pyrinomonadaceae bacterium]